MLQSKTIHSQFVNEGVDHVWKSAFHSTFEETDQYRAVTSHYGRHRFTTYWQVEHGINRELVKYMRGDRVEGELNEREAVDDYTHTYYEDIEKLYRENMFVLRV